MGWLHAIPAKEGEQPWPHDRLTQIRNVEKRDPNIPEVTSGQYLLDALLEAGPSYRDALGSERSLGWSEIHAYQMASQAITEPWEARALIDMSRAYLKGKIIGTDPLGMEPMESDVAELSVVAR